MDEVKDEMADKVINLLEDKITLPKTHHAIALVAGTVMAFVAKDFTQKMYKVGYKAYKAKKASE